MARAMLCPGCGAPLRWRGEAPVVECRYCHVHVVTESGKQAEASNDPASPDPNIAQSLPNPPGKLFAFLFLGLPLLLGSIALIEKCGVFGTQYEDVIAPGLEVTEAELIETFDLDEDEDGSLTVYFNHDFLNYITFDWEDGVTDHVTGFSFQSFETSDDWEEVFTRLRVMLGPRFSEREGGYWRWTHAGGYFQFSANRNGMTFESSPERDLDWKPRTEVMWAVMQSAVSGEPLHVEAAKLRAMTAVGLPVRELVALDVTLTIDNAQPKIREAFPTAVVDTSSDLEVEIPLQHPWIDRVEIGWKNAAAGGIDSIRFWPTGGKNLFADQEALRRCFESIHGEPAVITGNHAKKQYTYRWNLEERGALAVYDHIVTVDLRGRHPQELWDQTVGLLDGCTPN